MQSKKQVAHVQYAAEAREHSLDQIGAFNKSPPQLALITSFACIESAMNYWPPDVACELYCFMENDLAWVSKEWNGNMLSLMEHLAENDPSIETFADRITSYGHLIVALNSCIMELCVDPTSERGRLVQNAIRFLAKLSVFLSENQRCHPVGRIVLSAGSK